MSIFSTVPELNKIKDILTKYIRLPFSGETIPGAVMESVLAKVRNATALNTYDFVDVIAPNIKCGWQVKSTKEDTPVTWKRAKIPNGPALIKESRKNAKGLQALGDAIINFCNQHAQESLKIYGLDEIGYARLIIHKDGQVTYFERLLITKSQPLLFKPEDFKWRWSKPKKTKKKEQLPALHGFHRESNKKWWAWHGLGENQLHYSGESMWWPKKDDSHTVTFNLPSVSEKISLDNFIGLLDKLDENS